MLTTDFTIAATVLKQGDIVAIPTETVYGLAANIFDEAAVKKVFQLKGRPLTNPLIVHIASIDALDNIAIEVPEIAQKLAQTFWPGPLTLVLKKNPAIPHIITAGKETVAVRVPAHPLTIQLLQSIDFPLAAPSANPFGCISPTRASHVEQYFGEKLSVILDGGICERGIESTIIGFNDGQPVLYRVGSISKEDIEAITGKLAEKTTNNINPEAPGMMFKHYAPGTKTILTSDVMRTISQLGHQKIGVLSFTQAFEDQRIIHSEILSPKGSLEEACSLLYAALHQLDQCGADVIVAERFPDNHLGVTINDRLQRASHS